jgi:hypothetical protein
MYLACKTVFAMKSKRNYMQLLLIKHNRRKQRFWYPLERRLELPNNPCEDI